LDAKEPFKMQKHRILGAALVLFVSQQGYAQYPQEKLPLRKISMCGKN
jgi:hypothetical protein